MIPAAALLIVLGVLLLAFAWIGYPWWVSRRGRQPASWAPAGAESPSARRDLISVILATREPLASIVARVGDLRAGSYPAENLDVVIGLDHTRADGADALRSALEGQARVAVGTAPGKSAALNAAVAVAHADLLLFVDTAQTFDHDCIAQLALGLERGPWGAVTGTLAPMSGDGLMDAYWQRELAVRRGQASRHSVICVTGCVYLMRRQFWQDMPAGLICDDLWSTYSVVTHGSRVGIVPEARVTDPRRFTREQEYGRRLRTMTGLLQFVSWFPGALSPTRNPMLPHLFWHKLMRLLTPVLVILVAAAVITLVALLSPLLLAVGTAAFLAGVIGLFLLDRLRGGRRLPTLLFAFRLVVMPLRAMYQALRRDWNVWRPAA